MSNKLLPIIRKLFILIRIKFEEKKYYHLKYVFLKSDNSKKLIVVFSAFSAMGKPLRYNYMETLKDVNVNKLFILDSFGYNNAGSYYLGSGGIFSVPKEVIELINKLKEENKVEEIITAGTSKGGTAALFYGLKINADKVIIGAPQYHIGDYLNSEKHRPILEGICGDTSQKSVDRLNSLIKNEVFTHQQESIKPNIYIHYSPYEHTFKEQIKDMLVDLKVCGYKVYEDNDYFYKEHSDVGKYYQPFLLSNIYSDEE